MAPNIGTVRPITSGVPNLLQTLTDSSHSNTFTVAHVEYVDNSSMVYDRIIRVGQSKLCHTIYTGEDMSHLIVVVFTRHARPCL
jgi:hypothetical protein